MSNLPFVSKVLERAVAAQPQQYLNCNDLHASTQSAYGKCHNTETALIRVSNDLLRGLDRCQEAILLLLDLSAAFDTIGPQILLNRLEFRFGISGTVLKWITSYLHDRSQAVCLGSITSDKLQLMCGVPQGSVLCPVLFTLYTAPLCDIIHWHNLNYIIYADDTQIYSMMKPGDHAESIKNIEIFSLGWL